MKNCHVCNQLCEDNAEICPICGAFFENKPQEVENVNKKSEAVSIEPVLLATFEDLVSAEIFKDVLTDNNIPYCEPQGESMRVVFGGSFASEELYVDKADYDKAKDLYDEFMSSQVEFTDDDLFFTEE